MTSARRRIALAVALASAFALALGMTPAFAVHDLAFELDGNTKQDGASSNPVTYDWQNMFNLSNPPTGYSGSVPNVPNFGPSVFLRDFTPGSSADSSTFATGSKDTLPISPVAGISGNWQCAKSNNVGDKVDVNDAYAVAYVNPDNGHTIVYFGLDTSSNEGTRDAGFWFLQDSSVGCVAGAHATDFTGIHADGDVLITAEYTGTGGVSSIQAFVWVGGADGHLDTNPIATSADCVTGNVGTGDKLCATTNTSLIPTNEIGWQVQTKVGNKASPGATTTNLDKGEFFEGGIDLNANHLSGCFTKFLADTRSSTSPTATIFDYTLGSFPLCGLSATKTCPADGTVNAGGTSIHYKFDGTVKNTGGSTLNPVTLVDTLPTGTLSGTAAFKVGTEGIPNGNPLPGPANTTAPIVSCPSGAPAGAVCADLGSLSGGNTRNWSVEFDSTSLSPQNNAYASASLNSVTVSSDPVSATCSTTPNNTVTISKNCGVPSGYPNAVLPGTQLVTQSGLAAVQVNFSGQVCNTGQGPLTGVTLTDNPSATITVAWPGGNTGTLAAAGQAGDCAKYSGNYKPSGVTPGDLGGAAGRYSFTDEIKVTGATATLGASPGHDATCVSVFAIDAQACGGDTCNICPAGATCAGH